MSQRLLIAVGDADLAGAAAALASESDELEVVERVSEPEELARALRRLDVDVVALHDALGTVPVMEIAREIAATFPEVGMVLLAAEPTPELMRTAMQTGIRDVVALPLSLEQLESSVRAAAQWSRALRDRVSGEETAVGALAGNLIAVAGAKGGVGSTTVAIHLALAAAATRPGARSASSTSTSRRATCAPTWTRPTAAAWSTWSRSPTRSPSATCRRPCSPTARACACCSPPTTASAPRRSTRPSRATCSAPSAPATR